MSCRERGQAGTDASPFAMLCAQELERWASVYKNSGHWRRSHARRILPAFPVAMLCLIAAIVCRTAANQNTFWLLTRGCSRLLTAPAHPYHTGSIVRATDSLTGPVPPQHAVNMIAGVPFRVTKSAECDEHDSWGVPLPMSAMRCWLWK